MTKPQKNGGARTGVAQLTVPARTSLVIALAAWLLLSAISLFILWGMRDRARLIRDNDNERILTTLFASLRSYDDAGEAIEENPVLSERIQGFAVYDSDFSPTYRWGETPEFLESVLENNGKSVNNQNRAANSAYRFGRYTFPNRKNRSVSFIINIGRSIPMPRRHEGGRNREGMQHSPFAAEQNPPRRALFGYITGTYIYIDVTHSAYWRVLSTTTIALPLCILLFLAAVLYIRRLYLRNREYRDRIEAQQNLVMIGTAASTLAHEIKNPLLAIRLQTGILRKILKPSAPDKSVCMENGAEELDIIEEEIDRISALIYRVNDYLREERGHPTPVNAFNLLSEISLRLCGRNIVQGSSSAEVFIDPDRFRSVLENLIRNALESGGNDEGIGAAVEYESGMVIIRVFDRGQGFADISRAFAPFYTSKSAGTGIGLSISKRFVEAAGGTIAAANRDEGGAQVIITLPAYKRDASSHPQQTERQMARDTIAGVTSSVT